MGIQGLKHLVKSTMKLQLLVLSVILLSSLKGTEGCWGSKIPNRIITAERSEWNAAIENLVDRIDRAVPELGIKQNGFSNGF